MQLQADPPKKVDLQEFVANLPVFTIEDVFAVLEMIESEEADEQLTVEEFRKLIEFFYNLATTGTPEGGLAQLESDFAEVIRELDEEDFEFKEGEEDEE